MVSTCELIQQMNQQLLCAIGFAIDLLQVLCQRIALQAQVYQLEQFSQFIRQNSYLIVVQVQFAQRSHVTFKSEYKHI